MKVREGESESEREKEEEEEEEGGVALITNLSEWF